MTNMVLYLLSELNCLTVVDSDCGHKLVSVLYLSESPPKVKWVIASFF